MDFESNPHYFSQLIRCKIFAVDDAALCFNTNVKSQMENKLSVFSLIRQKKRKEKKNVYHVSVPCKT